MIRDLSVTTLHRYKADVTDHVSKMAVLEKAVDSLNAKEKKAAEDRNSAASGAIDWLGKLGLAYSGAEKLIGFATESLAQSANRMRLELAAGSINLDQLSAAAGGTISRMQLLDIAARTQHGSFKLTADQTKTVVEAMRELTREGFNQEEVLKKVTDAVVKLEGEGLKDFGIQIKQQATNTEKFAAVMEALTGKARALGDTSRTSAEEMQATAVSMEDAFATMRTELGKLVEAMTPLLRALASAVGFIADLANKKGAALEGSRGQYSFHNLTRKSLEGLGFSQDTIDSSWFGAALGPLADVAQGAYTYHAPEGSGTAQLGESGRQTTIELPGMDMRRKKGSGGIGADVYGFSDIQKAIESAIYQGIEGAIADFNAAKAGAEIYADSAQAFQDNLSQIGGASLEEWKNFFSDGDIASWARILDMSGEREPTLLERMFGTKEEFDGYKIGWDALTGAVTAGYDAMVDGTEDVGKAIQKSIAGALKALGSKLLIRGLEEEAEAIVSFDPRHALAGAAFIAAAGVAGALAHELGGSGPSAGAGGGGGRSASGPPRGGGDGGGSRTIVYAVTSTDPDDTPRMQQRRAARYFAQGFGEVGYGVTYS